MKLFFTFLLSSFMVCANAAIWEVEVGGTTSQTPYYAPQHLVIQVGDMVRWTFVSGLHNVTSTSGPEAFASGDLIGNSNGSVTYTKTFTQLGIYTYNCTFEGHSQTQFGSIRVEGTVDMAELQAPQAKLDFKLWPNPASDRVTIERSGNLAVDVSILDIAGKVVMVDQNLGDLRKEYSVAGLSTGIYFVEIKQNNQVLRKKLVIR